YVGMQGCLTGGVECGGVSQVGGERDGLASHAVARAVLSGAARGHDPVRDGTGWNPSALGHAHPRPDTAVWSTPACTGHALAVITDAPAPAWRDGRETRGGDGGDAARDDDDAGRRRRRAISAMDEWGIRPRP